MGFMMGMIVCSDLFMEAENLYTEWVSCSSGLNFTLHVIIVAAGEDKLQRRRLELTQATLDQPVDDEAVYLNVARECPKGRVYGLGSLGRKKRRYADPG
ncbi:hypothetical protein Scep_002538 [Stephania cephalantha]|uniref:Uncharacterized protein n=1 Tax=Stephania cephalantha TaxID=152367 RepID=A0AAP0Q4E0_9MAGN